VQSRREQTAPTQEQQQQDQHDQCSEQLPCGLVDKTKSRNLYLLEETAERPRIPARSRISRGSGSGLAQPPRSVSRRD
jgi:hypothetical protein